MLQFTDNALVGVADKLNNVANLGRIGHLFVYLYAGIEHGSLSVEHKSIAFAMCLITFSSIFISLQIVVFTPS